MTWTEAIITVLKKSKQNGESSMHYADITDAIINKEKLRDNYGKTPQRTVSAFLTTHPKLFENRNKGYYALTPEGELYTNKSKDDIDESIVIQETIAENKSNLIKAFGMYWDRSISIDIKHPKLLGRQYSKSKSIDSVDLSKIRGLYLLYDRREVIYVGQAIKGSILDRLKAHTSDRHAGRWDRFSWFGIDDIHPINGDIIETEENLTTSIYDIVNAFEGIMIEGLEPRQNRKAGNEFGDEYIQISETDQ